MDELSATQEFLLLGFSTNSAPLKQRWRNNGLSADFMGDYLTTFFPAREDEPTTINRQAEIKSSVSYIANELLENAMKFNDEKSRHPISLMLQLHTEKLVFISTNSVSPQSVKSFQTFIKELTTSDPSELYIRQLKKSAEDESVNFSRLGFLTIMNDYLTKVGWKFETVQKDPEVITVTTMVQLII